LHPYDQFYAGSPVKGRPKGVFNVADLPTAIFLMGPTASGKTDLAIELCQALPCDIISVDSALIYRGMDIGTVQWRDPSCRRPSAPSEKLQSASQPR
jgi:hypothetical protein